jgi:hypothetical protein
MKRFVPLLVLTLLCFGFTAYADFDKNVAGKVHMVNGSALAVQNAEVRILKEGDDVLIGDILSTGAQSRLEIAMMDEGRFRLGEQTSFVVTDYTFGQGNDNVVVELLKGAMDGVSGNIAKANPDGMKVLTRHATIGIRGTKFFVGELEGKIQVAHWSGGGVLVKNHGGEVFLKDENSGTTLSHDHLAPSAPQNWGDEKKKMAKRLVD